MGFASLHKVSAVLAHVPGLWHRWRSHRTARSWRGTAAPSSFPCGPVSAAPGLLPIPGRQNCWGREASSWEPGRKSCSERVLEYEPAENMQLLLQGDWRITNTAASGKIPHLFPGCSPHFYPTENIHETLEGLKTGKNMIWRMARFLYENRWRRWSLSILLKSYSIYGLHNAKQYRRSMCRSCASSLSALTGVTGEAWRKREKWKKKEEKGYFYLFYNSPTEILAMRCSLRGLWNSGPAIAYTVPVAFLWAIK